VIGEVDMPRVDYRSELFIDRKDALDKVVQSLRDLQEGNPARRVWHIYGHATQGKSWLLQHLRQEIEALGAGYYLMESYDQIDTLDEILEEATHQNNKYYLIAFDGMEMLSNDEFIYLEDKKLFQFVGLENIIVVLSSRQKYLSYRLFELRPIEQNSIWLDVFDIDDTEKQLDALRGNNIEGYQDLPQNQELYEDIYTISEGVPGLNALVAGQWDCVGEDDSGITKSCLEEILSRDDIRKVLGLNDGEVHRFLEAVKALSILDGFVDEEEMQPVLIDCSPVRDSDGAWDRKVCLKLIDYMQQMGSAKGYLLYWDNDLGFYKMDRQIRRLMSLQLLKENRDRWGALNRAIAELYEKWADEEDSDRYKEIAKIYWDRLREHGFQA